jgi:hypothetical protein
LIAKSIEVPSGNKRGGLSARVFLGAHVHWQHDRRDIAGCIIKQAATAPEIE